jgi:hypothetical protein
MFEFLKPSRKKRLVYPTYTKGFHGDDFLIAFTNSILEKSKNFIETGSAEATTLSFVAKNYPALNCFSCEADKKVFQHASKQIDQLKNVHLVNEHSPAFLYQLSRKQPGILTGETCLWLDAHGYGFEWPLRDEVKFVTSNFERYYMFIDDFKVPGQPQFGYDVYEKQECSLEYITGSLSSTGPLNIYFPKYSTKTSDYHPLRGWVLITNLDDAFDPRFEETVFQYRTETHVQ